MFVWIQPLLVGHERRLLEHTAAEREVVVDDDDDAESELMWRASPLLSLADIPWLIDDSVEPGIVLRYELI